MWITLHRNSGGKDGYRGDLPLERELDEPIVVDARGLGPCHPMFIIRLRLFLDWHLAAGHEVKLVAPDNPQVARVLVDMGVAEGLPGDVVSGFPQRQGSPEAIFGIRRLGGPNDVEDASADAMEVLLEQVPELAAWGDPVYMAVSELCGNALQHGRDDLGAYVAADRTDAERRQFRLAIADLGIGIPEHIRDRHPDWHDDTAAITRALERGVTGTGDPHRGNGFAEVFEETLDRMLVRTMSAVTVDIRSAKGRVIVDLIDGRQQANPGTVERARRGTWITYTVTSV
jgi:hypothetical protein